VNFGVDLVKWFESPAGIVDVHPVLSALLDRLKTGYPDLPNDIGSCHDAYHIIPRRRSWFHIFSALERRKTWIYEVPLELTHRLRATLNDAARPELNREQLDNADLPVVASTVKVASFF
jgi:hypothetical protein